VTLGAPTASFPALNALTTNQGTFTVSGGKTFTTAGALTNDSTINVSGTSSALTVAGGLANSGTPGAAGTTSIGSGSSLSAKYIRQNSLTVTGNASIAAQASGGGTSVFSSLSLGGTPSTPSGKLDIADTKMIVNDATANHATTAANINTLVNSAAHYVPATAKNLWDGNGITSSLLTGGADTLHSIGVADNATLGVFAKTTFGGQNVSSASILVAYTLNGDTNLDGKVDFSDFLNFQNGFGRSAPWQLGDFNHDGLVNFSDFLLFQNGFGRSMPGAGSTFITTEQRAEVAAFAASVPEPASIGLVMVGGLALLMRPRRSAVCERGGK
jgi:hypothetical protein